MVAREHYARCARRSISFLPQRSHNEYECAPVVCRAFITCSKAAHNTVAHRIDAKTNNSWTNGLAKTS